MVRLAAGDDAMATWTAWFSTNKDLAAIVLTVVGLLVTWGVTWKAHREGELRRDEVLAWADEAITAMQTLVLLCLLDPKQKPDPARLADVTFATSILVERGRLFFRNRRRLSHGRHKEPAYRGLRPRILDHLVLAHHIACDLPNANSARRALLGDLATRELKRFVSLAQKEVGRSRTRANGSRAPGQQISLAHELAAMTLSSRPPQPAPQE